MSFETPDFTDFNDQQIFAEAARRKALVANARRHEATEAAVEEQASRQQEIEEARTPLFARATNGLTTDARAKQTRLNAFLALLDHGINGFFDSQIFESHPEIADFATILKHGARNVTTDMMGEKHGVYDIRGRMSEPKRIHEGMLVYDPKSTQPNYLNLSTKWHVLQELSEGKQPLRLFIVDQDPNRYLMFTHVARTSNLEAFRPVDANTLRHGGNINRPRALGRLHTLAQALHS
jgi:hypothetical protein